MRLLSRYAIGDIFGSPFYMSPEQCNGEKLDNRSDIYSLGCTIFECLTGRPPFTGHLAAAVIFSHLEADPPSLESIVGPRRFPESMEVVMAKLLRKNPVERYQALSQLKSDLEQVAAGKEVLPVYRSREAKSVQPAQTRMQAEDRSWRTLPELSFRHAVIVFGLISLLLFLALGINVFIKARPPIKTMAHFKSPNRPGNLTDAESLDSTFFPSAEIDFRPIKTSDRADVARRLSGVRAITSSINEADGARVFNCPHLHIGTLAWSRRQKDVSRFYSGPGDGSRADAYAKARVPATVPIYMIVDEARNRDTWLYPEILARFGPNELIGLDIRNMSETANSGSAAEREAEGKQVAGLVQATSEWTNVQFFQFKNVPIPNQALLELDKHKTLKRLQTLAASFSADGLAKRKFLKQLHMLEIEIGPNVNQIFYALSGSSAIEEITAYSCPFSESGLKALAGCPNLKVLNLEYFSISTYDLAAITKIRSLKQLSIDIDNLKPEQIPMLVNLKFIPALSFTVTKWPIESMRRLHKVFPRAIIQQWPAGKSVFASDK